MSRWATLLTEKRTGARWHVASALSAAVYSRAFASFGRGSVIVAPERLRNCSRISVGVGCTLFEGCWLQAETQASWLELGDHNYVGRRGHLHAVGSVVIGSGCVIADNVFIGDSEHIPGDLDDVRSRGAIRIGDRVFVGVGAVILGGVTIGDDAIVGANAVVTKDVPAGAVVAGSPARVLHAVDSAAAVK